MTKTRQLKMMLDELEAMLRGYGAEQSYQRNLADLVDVMRYRSTCSPDAADREALRKAWNDLNQRSNNILPTAIGGRDTPFSNKVRAHLREIEPVVSHLLRMNDIDFRSQFISPKQAFISYAREDEDFAKQLRLQLGTAGYQPWWDQTGIRGGQKWRDIIDQEIRRSVALVVIVTSHSVQSEFVFYEWAFALGAGVDVIPILLDDARIWEPLEPIHWRDFRNDKHKWSELFTDLDEIVKKICAV